ncbi:hypothetical protein BDZ89DRAFT_49751 [Hymenopellis radicata]|nr:hypothetical protein BDZ89DRAFT_49751 [Hymenopellis radicata]
MTEAQYEMFVRVVIGNATTAKQKEKARRKVFRGDRKPWDKTIQQPHPSTTLLSHFSDKISAPWFSPYTTPLVQAVYEARCEISSDSSLNPTNIHISADSNCVVVSCAGGGLKNNEPALDHYVLSPSANNADGFPQCHSVKLGLDEITPFITTDVSRRLVFMADEERVKSFRWDDDLPVHTLASGSLRGPITVLPDGKLVRAGKGKLAVWKLDKQPTHGPDGKKVIGKTMDVDEDDDGDADNIEPSSGTRPSSKVRLDSALKDWNIKNWVAHPSLPGTMITSAKNQCALISIDIAHGRKTGTKYIGQGGMARAFSTDPSAAPNAFVTGCEDGEIRLWDTRQPLPVLTMEVGHGAMPSVALAHPDGVPTIFGGSVKAEVIKVYDVRGRQMVYELATGNNQVVGLAWDRTRSTLWAATECNYLDPYRNPYRSVKLPGYIKSRLNEDSSVYGRSWPNNAYHLENYFGDILNTGAHTTLRFQFKPDADPCVVPPYSARW